MSVGRIFSALLVLSIPVGPACARVACPAHVLAADGTVHTLSGARVFRGAVSKQAEIVSVHGHFDVASVQRAGGDTLNLVCIYGGTQETTTVEVPPAATACDVSDAGSGAVASCR